MNKIATYASLSERIVCKWTPEEVKELKRFVRDDWACKFPGWAWVSGRMKDVGYTRTAAACKAKFNSIYSSKKNQNNQ